MALFTVYGAEGTFGDLAAATRTPTGEGFEVVSVPDWVIDAGKSIGFIGVDSETGIVVIPLASSNAGGLLAGAKLQIGQFDPATLSFTAETIPTDEGATDPRSIVYGGGCVADVKCYGGAVVSDTVVFTDGDGARHVLHNTLSGYGSWDRVADGVYPVLVFRTLTDGVWGYDAALSRTADAMAADTAEGAVAFPAKDTADISACFGSHEYHDAKGIAEMDVFPNGHVLLGQYFAGPDSDPAVTSGWVTVVGPDGDGVWQDLANYQFPMFYDPKGAVPPSAAAVPLSFAVRSVSTDPTSDDETDLRFFVCPDLFFPDAASASLSEGKAIATIARSGNIVTVTTVDDHLMAVGQFPRLSGMTGAYAVFNDTNGNAFASLRDPILTVPTSKSFTIHRVGANQVSHLPTGVPIVQQQLGACFIEMAYNAVAGTIAPVSKPCFPDTDQRNVGLVVVNPNSGDAWLQYSGNLAFASGPSPVYLKDAGTGERSNVTQQPAGVDISIEYGAVATPDFTFGATRGANGFGGMVIDPRTDAVYQLRSEVKCVLPDAPLAAGTNLFTDDAGMETAGIATDWTGFVTGVAQSAAQAHSGAGSLRLRPQGVTGAVATSVFAVPVEALQSYEASIWMKVVNAGAQSGRISFKWLDAVAATISTSAGPLVLLANGSWKKCIAAFGAPSNAVTALIVLEGLDIGAGLDLYVDDLSVTRAPGTHLPDLDFGFDDFPVTGTGVSTQKGALDATNRYIWIEVAQYNGEPACPATARPQWLGRLDMAAHLAPFTDPDIEGPTYGVLVDAGSTYGVDA